MKPIIKWAGGKRQLLPEILKRIPKDISTYYEPFLGGGAVAFELQWENAVLNDYNGELMLMYDMVRKHPATLIVKIQEHLQKNSSEHYYTVRNADRDEFEWSKLTDVEQAARFIYLNKTGYNGLYRVNSKGQNNVPFGKYKKAPAVDYENLIDICCYLRNRNVMTLNYDYAEIVKDALREKDKKAFFYFDPPYVPLNATSAFTAYTADGFGMDEQIALCNCCKKLKDAGIRFLLSNSSAPAVYELYKDFKIEEVYAKRAINSNGSKRGAVKELLIS